MDKLRADIKKNLRLKGYLELINRIAKSEYRSLSASHLIEYDELVNIGIQTVDILTSQKEQEDYNDSYLSTAIKWAIRNELRRRYRWHGVKNEIKVTDDVEKSEVREAVYRTILSTDEMLDAEKPVEVRDDRRTPEENVEFSQISVAIKHAITMLPRREKELIESKFYKGKKLHELADEYSISPSRISRIIKSGLDKIKNELIRSEAV